MEDKPRYSRVSDIVDLIIFMLSKLDGVTLNDIQERFNVSRRTAERMRDSILAILPQVDEIETGDRSKHWGFINYSLIELIGFSKDDIKVLNRIKTKCGKIEKFEIEKIIIKLEAYINQSVNKKTINKNLTNTSSPTFIINKPNLSSNTLFVGIGGAGCKILSKISSKNKKIYIDTDIDVVRKYNGLQVGENTCKGYSTNGEITLGELSVRESKGKLLHIIQNYNCVVIVAPMGGGTSCGTTKKFVDLLLDNNKKVRVLTSVPFDFEGVTRLHKAVECLDYIETLCEVINVPNYNYRKLSVTPSLIKIFDKQDSLYIKTIEKLYF